MNFMSSSSVMLPVVGYIKILNYTDVSEDVVHIPKRFKEGSKPEIRNDNFVISSCIFSKQL